MFEKKILSPEKLTAVVAGLKAQGKKIVTTNGAFDIVHSGHVNSLLEAKKQGDILIVGLNSDASVRAYKSPDRPIIPQDHRALMLAALQIVDFVVILDPPDVSEPLINLVKPDVHVKSKSGYKGVEGPLLEQYGGKLVLLDDIPGMSTTYIIQRILELEGKALQKKG